MKIKYNLLTLSLLGFMSACNPMEDIYNEIDAKGTVITKSEDEYILTSADYESISKAAKADARTKADTILAENVKSMKALNSFASADKYVPGILASLYPSWGKGSNVGVTYNFYEEETGLVSELRNISIYSLSQKDYEQIWGNDENKATFLSPKREPSEVIPGILAEAYKNAEENEMVLVDYMYDTKDLETVQGQDLFSEDFSSLNAESEVNLSGWNEIITEGSRKWTAKEYGGNIYVQMTAYGSKEKVGNWLITPDVKITEEKAKFSFDVKFGYHNGDALKVYISDKFDGSQNINSDDWTEITGKFTFPEGVSSGYTDMVSAGEYSLADYLNKDVHFAFVYNGEDGNITTTVQIDNVRVSSTYVSESNEKPYSMLFRYNGSDWKVYNNEEVVLVTPADYDAMGAPGSHDNFSSTDNFEKYLPQFLANKFPYAQNGDTKVVLFKYYADKQTTVVPARYNFNTNWTYFQNIVVREKETFLHNGEKWLFDPSIHVTIDTDGYKYIVEWVAANKPGYMDPAYDDSEYWFGASYHYNNFNIQIVKRRSYDPEKVVPADDNEARKYLENKVGEGLKLWMSYKYADAPSQMNGVDLYYYVSCKVYDGAGYYKYTFKAKSLGNGNFEYEGEPEITGW